MILIISRNDDSITDEICSWLLAGNKQFIRLNENQEISSIHFDFTQDVFKITIDNDVYNLNDITSAFYRNGTFSYSTFNNEEIDERIEEFYNAEFRSVTQFIFYYLKAKKIPMYGNFFVKEVNKLEVLHLAKLNGFKVPETYIFSEISAIRDVISKKGHITKAISEMQPVISEGSLYLNYTRQIFPEDLQNKIGGIVPTLLQDMIHPDFEIRVFFFEKMIWALATFDFENNVDIRNIKEIDKRYIPYELPKSLQIKILKLAGQLQLKCGTIDLLKTEKDIYFLEVNPLGQFHQVSYFGNYNIGQFIANLL